MELMIIIAIVGLAAAYTARNFYKSFQAGKNGGCGCGCSSCGSCPGESAEKKKI